MLRGTFRTVLRAAVEAKLTSFRALSMRKGKGIVKCSSRLFKLVSELKCAGHKASGVEKKCALLQGMMVDFEMTAKVIMSVIQSYEQAIAK